MNLIFRKKLFDSRVLERVLEIIPGVLVWSALLMPIILSLAVPRAVALFIIGFDLYWTIRWYSLSYYLLKGYRELKSAATVDWLARLKEMEQPAELKTKLLAGLNNTDNKYVRHANSLAQEDIQYVLSHPASVKDWRSVYHMVVLATFKESLDILEPSVRAVAESNFPLDRVVFVLAGEERDAENASRNGAILKEKYGHNFAAFYVELHPNNPDEGKVKGSGISYAAAEAKRKFIDLKGIDTSDVIVTVLDSDTVIHREFLPYLTHKYILNPNRKYRSFQPIPFFYNNIWDVPAPMRLIATGSSFWQIIESMRPHRLRNFSSHSQALDALVETDYWDRFSINDDSRQFWRTYFTFNGNHSVVPLFVPVFNDAVLSPTYLESFRNQYLQLRRWAYGISEFPYVVRHFMLNNKIHLGEKISKTLRLLEGHFSWATAPLFMAVVAWLPLFLNREFKDQILAHKLPTITSWILTVGMSGLVFTIWLSLLLLPKRPKRYGFRRHIGMVLQWGLLPVTTILFSSIPSIDSHTRLMFGRYLGFRVTEKARKAKVESATKTLPA